MRQWKATQQQGTGAESWERLREGAFHLILQCAALSASLLRHLSPRSPVIPEHSLALSLSR